MNKLISTMAILLLALLPGLVLVSQASAAVNLIPSCQGGSLDNQNASVCTDVNSVNGKTHDPIYTIIKAAIEVISFVTGAAAVILIIISGISFMTSGGDPNKVSGARNTLLYALIGIFIVMISQGIIAFVLDRTS